MGADSLYPTQFHAPLCLRVTDMGTLSEATQLVAASIKRHLQHIRRWRHLSNNTRTTSYHPQLITVSLRKSLQGTDIMEILRAGRYSEQRRSYKRLTRFANPCHVNCVTIGRMP